MNNSILGNANEDKMNRWATAAWTILFPPIGIYRIIKHYDDDQDRKPNWIVSVLLGLLFWPLGLYRIYEHSKEWLNASDDPLRNLTQTPTTQYNQERGLSQLSPSLTQENGERLNGQNLDKIMAKNHLARLENSGDNQQRNNRI